MKDHNLLSSDSFIGQYIQKFLLKKELEGLKINNILSKKFNIKAINNIRNGIYVFNIEEFIFITNNFNINIEDLFTQISKNQT